MKLLRMAFEIYLLQFSSQYISDSIYKYSQSFPES